MKKRKAMALALCAAMMMGTFGGFEVKAATVILQKQQT